MHDKTARSIAAYQQRIAWSFLYSFAFFASLREVFIKKERRKRSFLLLTYVFYGEPMETLHVTSLQCYGETSS